MMKAMYTVRFTMIIAAWILGLSVAIDINAIRKKANDTETIDHSN